MIPLATLRKQYNALSAEERSGAVGEALANEINSRARKNKVGVCSDSGLSVREYPTTEVIRGAFTKNYVVKANGKNRNLPCPCGSGLKFKRCCFYNEKPVTITP